MRRVTTAAMIGAALLLAGCSSSSSSSSSTGSATDANAGGGSPVTVRLGLLSNITHASALVALKNGFFNKDLGTGTVKTTVFSTGTEETTAMLAGQLDAAYVGPNPAINAWQKSDGKAIKIVSGPRPAVRPSWSSRASAGPPAEGPVGGHAVARQHAGRGACGTGSSSTA